MRLPGCTTPPSSQPGLRCMCPQHPSRPFLRPARVHSVGETNEARPMQRGDAARSFDNERAACHLDRPAFVFLLRLLDRVDIFLECCPKSSVTFCRRLFSTNDLPL